MDNLPNYPGDMFIMVDDEADWATVVDKKTKQPLACDHWSNLTEDLVRHFFEIRPSHYANHPKS